VQYPAADILTSSDHLRNTVADEGLERWPDAGSAANIGIMLFRSTARNLASVLPVLLLLFKQARHKNEPLLWVQHFAWRRCVLLDLEANNLEDSKAAAATHFICALLNTLIFLG
jgi:hypothetical protein